nr:hypothetical protein [Iodidimonas nitroreducens]
MGDPPGNFSQRFKAHGPLFLNRPFILLFLSANPVCYIAMHADDPDNIPIPADDRHGEAIHVNRIRAGRIADDIFLLMAARFLNIIGNLDQMLLAGFIGRAFIMQAQNAASAGIIFFDAALGIGNDYRFPHMLDDLVLLLDLHFRALAFGDIAMHPNHSDTIAMLIEKG